MLRELLASAFYTLCLYTLHTLHLIARCISSLRRPTPRPLAAKRDKTPKHLSILLVLDDRCSRAENEVKYLQSVHNIARWCLAVGVQKLSVFDAHGILADAVAPTPSLSERLSKKTWKRRPELPLTPPSSEPSSELSSRPRTPVTNTSTSDDETVTSPVQTIQWNEYTNFFRRSPSNKRRQSPPTPTLTLDIIPPQCAKPSLASATRALASKHIASGSAKPPIVNVDELHSLMEGPYGFTSPDLILIHHLSGLPGPRRMYGYPPWQTHLSEIHFTQPSALARLYRFLRNDKTTRGILTEQDFRRALDQYKSAEMRHGR